MCGNSLEQALQHMQYMCKFYMYGAQLGQLRFASGQLPSRCSKSIKAKTYLTAVSNALHFALCSCQISGYSLEQALH